MDEVERLQQAARDDERLLRRAEKVLTQIKVAQGISEQQAAVLAALRIRLRGDPGKSLEDLLTAAGDLDKPGLGDLLSEETKPKPSLDDVLSQKRKPKPKWPGG